jgi:hypothetical protein
MPIVNACGLAQVRSPIPDPGNKAEIKRLAVAQVRAENRCHNGVRSLKSEGHGGWFEVTFIQSADGFANVFLVPDRGVRDSGLLYLVMDLVRLARFTLSDVGEGRIFFTCRHTGGLHA